MSGTLHTATLARRGALSRMEHMNLLKYMLLMLKKSWIQILVHMQVTRTALKNVSPKSYTYRRN